MRGSFRAIGVILSVAIIATIAPSFRGVCAAAAFDKWLEPVQGEIVRRFEAPLGPYATGHRGLDFSAPVGTEVIASGPGTVKFAGPVAGDGFFVTIAHEAELQTTYSFMSTVTVVAGQRVNRGETIGASGNGHPESPAPVLHFGVKLAGVYIDPEILLYADPTDISNVIALAPFEDTGQADEPLVQNEGSLLRKIDFKAPGTPDRGFFAGIGEAIGSGLSAGFNWIKQAPGNFFDWLKSTGASIKDGIVNGSRKAGEILGSGMTRIGSALADAGKGIWKAIKWLANGTWTGIKAGGSWSLKAIKSLTGWVWTGVRATVRWADRVTQAAAMAIDAAARSLAEGMRDLWRYVKNLPSRLRNWLAEKAHDLADALNGPIERLKDSFIGRRLRPLLGLAQGLVRESACQLEGGAPPPKLPTIKALQDGAPAPPPPNDNIVIAIAGLGSSTRETADGVTTTASAYQGDWMQLGYKKGSVYHFSYKGIENRGISDEYALHAVYRKEDTFKSIEDSALQLEEQVNEIHRRHPGKKIDIVAHSQGGLVAQHYITWIYNRDNREGLDISHFVSISSPHQGADLAQIHVRLSDNDAGRKVLSKLEAVAAKMDWPSPSSQAAQEMAEDSTYIKDLDDHWDPSKVPTTTIAASYDLTVTAQHTRLKGASHYTSIQDGWVLPWDEHGKIVNSMATKQIIYNTLAGTPSRCTGFRDFRAEFISGETISNVEDGLITIIDRATDAHSQSKR